MVKGRKKIVDLPDFELPDEKFPPVLYGLDGIMRIFKVSKATASRYKNTILKDAVTQQGHVIIVDSVACLRAFGLRNPERLVMKSDK